MVSMARPFLADAEIVLKTIEGRVDEINTCIACNQACLDHTFNIQICSCLVNPRACHETILNFPPVHKAKKIAVVGAGPAGLAASTYLAERGHEVHLYEAASETGGQFNMAKVIPGKEEYAETIRYYNRMIDKTGVNLYLNKKVSAQELIAEHFEEIVLATGVTPRRIQLEGIDHPMVLDYAEVLYEKKPVGQRVAIIGAGGIGYDVAEYLSHGHEATPSLNTADYMKEWGVDMTYATGGALQPAEPEPSPRQIFMLKRSTGKSRLGKTTGWIHRASLNMKKVLLLAKVEYVKIDDQGLTINHTNGSKLLEVDNVVVCAGQEPLRDLQQDLVEAGMRVHLIGGADEAKELDAKRAIKQAAELAATL